MGNVNLLNRAALESALEALGCVHDAESIVEKMQDYVIYYTREAERFLVEILTVVENYTRKLFVMFNILEDEDGETEEKNVEFESAHLDKG
ncbi:uncharacterized protein SRCM100730_02741 [Bacillus velezensis]|uniref:hypothetical protein n=1 Tax=Bacillus amyloliquefaciens group TaxID=1938374 RepID=UPI0007F942C6|nr:MULTISPECIES: hypothetical protein [Bacillus amyloliquefaciens group]MCR6617457.1 hypothetical protein [Bacillus amyloliquefaciens]MEC0448412.1 hypothetical protein [Bacillus velezensis]OBR25910.1 uncharacterized protein SRCM100731_03977 [Bacillus velezensis]OCB95850.1 uncharacterized protein SRCM100730_02741 [Bacillus velezensis]QMI90282.1 hypothetical protein H1Q60_09420 [Bacillus velezensis]